MPFLNKDHKGEKPKGTVLEINQAFEVKLTDYRKSPFQAMYDFITGTWGLDPEFPIPWNPDKAFCQAAIAECVNRRTLPLALEIPAYTFTVKGVTRIDTHQFVRQRIGATFSQACTGDNDIRHASILLPLNDFELAINRLISSGKREEADKLRQVKADVIRNVLESMRLYGAAVDLGYPLDKARLWTPEGKSTYIHFNFSLATLSAFLGRRLCENQPLAPMALAMVEEVIKVHPVFAPLLIPNCDKSGYCTERAANGPFGAANYYPCGRKPRILGNKVYADDYLLQGTAADFRGFAVMPGAKTGFTFKADERKPQEMKEAQALYDTSIESPQWRDKFLQN